MMHVRIRSHAELLVDFNRVSTCSEIDIDLD
jgi:hypothetical protein